MTSRGHCEAVNLRLDVNNLLSVGFEPGNINFDVKVTNAIRTVRNFLTPICTVSSLANNGILRHNFKML